MNVLKRALPAAVAGWIAIDVYMSAVYVAFGSTVLRLFQWDASTVLGRVAYTGGPASALLGVLLDFTVSYAWACIAIYTMMRVAWVRNHAIAFGVLFGIIVMFAMIWVVVPLLGQARQAPKSLENVLVILLGHTAFFGVPVAIAARASIPRPRFDASA